MDWQRFIILACATSKKNEEYNWEQDLRLTVKTTSHFLKTLLFRIGQVLYPCKAAAHKLPAKKNCLHSGQ